MALTRLFNGKKYHFHSQHSEVTDGRHRAEAKAEKIRQQGGKARITAEGHGLSRVWIVWSRERRY